MKKLLPAVFVSLGAGGVAFIAILLLGLPVMLLWNWLMPDIFGLKEITFLQAIGIQFLAYLIFPKSTSSSKE